MTKNSNKSLIARPSRKTTSQSKSAMAQRSIAAASKKTVISQVMSERLGLAERLEATQQWGQAEEQYKLITDTYPNFAAAWHAWGLLAFKLNQLDLASQLFAKAVVLDQGQALYHRNLGEISRRLGRLDQAILSGKSASQLTPKDRDAFYNLALAYTDAKDYKNAAQTYRKVIKLDTTHALAWNNLGSSLEHLGLESDAFNAYAKAIAINPEHFEAQNNLGALYFSRGKLDEARACFEKAIASSPHFVLAHYNISSLKTYTAADPHLPMLQAILGQESQLDTFSRIRYHFALGKALEDIGDAPNAFASYQLANQLEKAQDSYDEGHSERIYSDITKTFNPDFFEQRRGWKASEATPIFIVGMPRSGTSLLEQILDSHPSIYGAGELTDLDDALVKAVQEKSSHENFGLGLASLSEDEVAKVAKEYCQRVWKLSPKSQFIVDKMPANFFYLGLIYLMFPRAKVIHIERDPMDSCFSCFTRLFDGTMGFSHDLNTLGRYYVRYSQLMQHWYEVLPKEFILNVRYEDLVDNLEVQAKRVTEFIGLPWDENCLAFHANERVVKTASVAQVRKPIYRSSIARWRKFAPYLRSLYELVKTVRQYPEESDEIFQSQSSSTLLAQNMNLQVLEAEAKDLIERCIQLQGQQDHLGTLRLMEGQISLVQRSPVLLHLQGISFYRLDRFNEAIAAYELALQLQPQFPAALNSLGFVLQDVGRMQEALNAFAKALEFAPEFSMARLNLGLAQLKLGDWENGWDNYEARWTGSAETASPDFKRPNLPIPQWDGQDGTESQGLLVVTEQGFGDTFQFSRFLLQAKKRFARVGFACSQPTQRLLEWAMGNDIVLLTSLPTDYAVWSWYCPLMSLPRALKVRVETIPSPEPYFSIPVQAKTYWAERLEALAPGRFRVGIAWTGRKSHQYDARRSIRFEQITQLLETPYVTWVSLQKWGAEEIGPTIPASVDWLDFTPDFMDFADTAAMLSNLDLVISVDSSLVHLAGMMGVPVWMLNRFDSEWRWLGAREDSPWYPHLKIFNQQKFGDWTWVLDEVGRKLQEIPKPQVLAQPRMIGRSSLGAVTPSSNSPLSHEQAMQLASQLQSAGRPQEAENILKQLIAIDPSNAHALHLAGVTAYQLGHLEEAINLIRKATKLLPNQALFHSNLGEMLRQNGNATEAIICGELAIQLDPMLACAYSNLGIAFYDVKEYVRAEAAHQQAIALDSHSLQSLNNLGSIERAKHNRLAAIEWYQKVLTINANYIETLSNLGAVLVESDRADEAVPLLERGLSLSPNSAELLSNLGLAYFKQDKWEHARELFEKALQLKPHYATALTGLAAVFNEFDELDRAEDLLKQALVSEPDKLDAYCQLGIVYMQQGKESAAQTMFERALEIEPKSTDALTGLGNLNLEAGKVDDAERLLRRAIAIDSDNVDARFHLSQVKKVLPGDENLIALEAVLAKGEKLSDTSKISLYYALGKSYDDIKEYDKAFENFNKGAQLKRSKLNYDADADERFICNIIKTVDASLFKKLSGNGYSSNLPIFVLGMPRSGTTLTEQIIASHPQVHGAGELSDLAQVIQGPLLNSQVLPYPQSLMSQNIFTQLAQWGKDYCERLQRYAPQANRITDKMPSNYLLMGLIPLILPEAKIIHVKRNPVDTCLSCFTRLFNRHQDGTYDLSELGRSYANYSLLMEHWKKILPEGSFLEVQYEELVGDVDTQARRLIEYCGLDWDANCLSFYQNKRNVRTASVTQVRQPIYETSVKRWKNYEKHLTPLLNALQNIHT